jgi:hypothetical protein
MWHNVVSPFLSIRDTRSDVPSQRPDLQELSHLPQQTFHLYVETRFDEEQVDTAQGEVNKYIHQRTPDQ